jgi:hypothetical protein
MLLALLIIVPTVVINRQNIANAFVLATTHQPERFTELYFVNSSLLPSYTPTAKIQHITFRITNHEAYPIAYTYIIAQDTSQLAKNTITLSDAQSTDVTFTYSIPTPKTGTILSVSLINRTEHIAFRTKS